ncbi:Zinc finger, RING/FYVE/PHD-type [Senna tora]|uniref:Zinc finger, RING/FYVE/PHD-type n=1 Tax=Senna tora TaxID=362788 RepID=A0A834TQE4_9FABA|nr:Zinc finger, RING/FYVE/PHD-type [Senna tora]
MESRRRVTLYDQMSAVDSSRNSLAGLILDAAAMASHKSAAAAASAPSRGQLSSSSRTLQDIIREDESSKKNHRKSWKLFREKLRLKRAAGSAWFSAIHITLSDIPIPHRNSTNTPTTTTTTNTRPQQQTPRSDSLRRDAAIPTTFRDCFDYTSSSSNDENESNLAREATRRLSSVISEERALSARESEAAAAAAATAAEEDEPVRMSLMDLLEETDRQMGFEGSGYRLEDEEWCEKRERKEVEEDDDEEEEYYNGGIRNCIAENRCCVCMVRRKGAAFIPCGHTFCRQCSRELWVLGFLCGKFCFGSVL